MRNAYKSFCVLLFVIGCGVLLAQAPREPYPKYAIMVERVKPNATNAERSRWKTYGTSAIIPGKDAELWISYDEKEDVWYIQINANRKHAATDGFTPQPKIVHKGMINQLWIEARDERKE